MTQAQARMTAEQPPRDPRLILDLASAQLNLQLGAVDSLEAKAGVFFGVGSALMGILVGVVALRPVPNWEAAAAVGAAVAAYLMVTISSVLVYRLTAWKTVPKIEDEAVYWANHTDEETAWHITKTLLAAVDFNAAPYADKVHRLRVSLWCVAIETVCLLALGFLVVRG
jgi:hypothetical protein